MREGLKMRVAELREQIQEADALDSTNMSCIAVMLAWILEMELSGRSGAQLAGIEERLGLIEQELADFHEKGA